MRGRIKGYSKWEKGKFRGTERMRETKRMRESGGFK